MSTLDSNSDSFKIIYDKCVINWVLCMKVYFKGFAKIFRGFSLVLVPENIWKIKSVIVYGYS